MSRLYRLTPQDLEALSAYADGALSPAERQQLEARLQSDPGLRQALAELRATMGLLRSLPVVRPPRSLAITPEMAGMRRRAGFAYPVLQLATAIASLAFIVTVGLDIATRGALFVAQRAMAPAPQALAGASEVQTMASPAAGQALPEAGAMKASAGTPTPAPTPLAESTLAASNTTAMELPPTVAVLSTTEVSLAAPPEAVALTPTVQALLGAAAYPTPTVGCDVCGDKSLMQTEVAADRLSGSQATPEPELQAAAATSPAPAATELGPEEPRGTAAIPLRRWLEAGLGGAAIVFGALTLWLRRRRR